MDEQNLTQVFQIVAKRNQKPDSISQEDFIELVEKLNQQMVLQAVNISRVPEDNLINAIENYKVVFNELSLQDTQKQWDKKEVFEHILKNNYHQKLLTLKMLDRLQKDRFALFEFKKFFEDLEKEIIYQSQLV